MPDEKSNFERNIIIGMKGKHFLFLLLLFFNQLSAQVPSPKLAYIAMIGKTNKPIFDLYIVDSMYKAEYKFDLHTDYVYTDKSALVSIFSVFASEKADSIGRGKKAFWTFMFYFLFGNNDKAIFITDRTPSAVLLQKIICVLKSNSDGKEEIIRLLKYRLGRINY